MKQVQVFLFIIFFGVLTFADESEFLYTGYLFDTCKVKVLKLDTKILNAFQIKSVQAKDKKYELSLPNLNKDYIEKVNFVAVNSEILSDPTIEVAEYEFQEIPFDQPLTLEKSDLTTILLIRLSIKETSKSQSGQEYLLLKRQKNGFYTVAKKFISDNQRSLCRKPTLSIGGALGFLSFKQIVTGVNEVEFVKMSQGLSFDYQAAISAKSGMSINGEIASGKLNSGYIQNTQFNWLIMGGHYIYNFEPSQKFSGYIYPSGWLGLQLHQLPFFFTESQVLKTETQNLINLSIGGSGLINIRKGYTFEPSFHIQYPLSASIKGSTISFNGGLLLRKHLSASSFLGLNWHGQYFDFNNGDAKYGKITYIFSNFDLRYGYIF